MMKLTTVLKIELNYSKNNEHKNNFITTQKEIDTGLNFISIHSLFVPDHSALMNSAQNICFASNVQNYESTNASIKLPFVLHGLSWPLLSQQNWRQQ